MDIKTVRKGNIITHTIDVNGEDDLRASLIRLEAVCEAQMDAFENGDEHFMSLDVTLITKAAV